MVPSRAAAILVELEGDTNSSTVEEVRAEEAEVEEAVEEEGEAVVLGAAEGANSAASADNPEAFSGWRGMYGEPLQL